MAHFPGGRGPTFLPRHRSVECPWLRPHHERARYPRVE
jgi:hypothetical protein